MKYFVTEHHSIHKHFLDILANQSEHFNNHFVEILFHQLNKNVNFNVENECVYLCSES